MSDASENSTAQGASTIAKQDLEKKTLQTAAKNPNSIVEDQGQETEKIFDNGKAAWMTVCGVWMVQFCTYGYVSAFGVYQDYYSRYFLSKETPSTISWIGSIQLFLQYAAGVVVGQAFDAGYFHHMIALGTALQILSMFMLSLARQHHYYEVFLAQALGMGIGQSLLFLPSLTILGHHFRRRRALATGISVSGSSIGGIAWPIMLNELSQRVSFPNAIRITAALNGMMLLASNFLMKTQSTQKLNANRANRGFGVIFKDSAYLVSVASAFCINIGIFFPYFYLQLFAITLGIRKSLAFYSIAILNVGSFFGRLLPSLLADRVGAYNMLLPSLVVASALAFVMFGVSNFMGVAVFGLFYGFWSGAYVSLIPSLLAQLSTHPGEHGTRMGTAFSIVGISVLIGTPIEGSLLHTDGEKILWSRSIIFCGCTILCGAAGMAVSRFLFVLHGRGGSKKGWV